MDYVRQISIMIRIMQNGNAGRGQVDTNGKYKLNGNAKTWVGSVMDKISQHHSWDFHGVSLTVEGERRCTGTGCANSP